MASLTDEQKAFREERKKKEESYFNKIHAKNKRNSTIFGTEQDESYYETYNKIRNIINTRKGSEYENMKDEEFILMLIKMAREGYALPSSSRHLKTGAETEFGLEGEEILNLIFEYFRTFTTEEKDLIDGSLTDINDPEHDYNKKIHEFFLKKSNIMGGSRRRKSRRRKTRRRKSRLRRRRR